MRPEAPTIYRATLLERVGLQRWLSPPSRMILRHLERRPVKTALSVVGIALACAILTTGRFQEDTVGFMMNVQYGLSQRQDLTVTFVDPTSRRALYDLLSLPGVEYGEVFREVPVRLRFAHRSYRTGILGIEPAGRIRRLLDTELKPVHVPEQGIVLADYLGKILGVRPGDMLTIEILEGRRAKHKVKVAKLVSQYIGLSSYMDLNALNRIMREGHAISGAFLSVDEQHLGDIYRRLKEMPRVAGTVVRKQEIINFNKTMQETMLFFVTVATVFAVIIAFGVIYNSARITLTERSRELASLRVLGFTRGEISYILLGELAVMTLLAIPLGLLIGHGLCGYIASSIETDLYRVPLIIEPDTYAFAALVTLIAAAVSALVVRRKLDQLDLIAVLKTKE
jgi:putative ABC transport system permease protein